MDIKSMLPESLKDMAPVLQGILDAAKDQTAITQLKSDLEGKINAIKSLPEGIDVAKMREDLQSLVTGFSELQAKMPKQGTADKSVNKGLLGELQKAWDEKKSEIEGIIKSGGLQDGPLVFELKDAVVMGDNTTIGSGATQQTLTEDTGIVSTIRKRPLRYFQTGVSIGTISKPYALWIEETDEQGNPIPTGEGAPKPQGSVLYVEKREQARKIPFYGKVTTEMMEDLPQLVSYIQENMRRRTEIVTENGLVSGDGLGNNLKGIKQYASAFTGGGLAGSISNPNDFDVILAAASQVSDGFGVANGFLIGNNVFYRMLSNKTTDGQYILPQGVAFDAASNTINAWGISIVPSKALGNDEFVGGDMTVVKVRYRKGMTIQIGLDGNDFTNNVKTLLVEQRLVQFVSANDTQVLVKGTFAVAKGVIDSGS
jgi:HK97 family phage major capsid protein